MAIRKHILPFITNPYNYIFASNVQLSNSKFFKQTFEKEYRKVWYHVPINLRRVDEIWVLLASKYCYQKHKEEHKEMNYYSSHTHLPLNQHQRSRKSFSLHKPHKPPLCLKSTKGTKKHQKKILHLTFQLFKKNQNFHFQMPYLQQIFQTHLQIHAKKLSYSNIKHHKSKKRKKKLFFPQ